ncbi:hypothetical protein BGZ80_011041 [Entomortierella chlamydospora]|uniref:Transcription elongation factor 1 homolog n=1 Tax=Entomortierella chlamydospora TaxID=101097 RepID=A0A9P6N3T9_9FUNG|nr:hypothetical protein BGZ80_011041 [Entomortierella chlamydospora]
MGKRKSSRKPQAKVKKTLDTQFDCVACFHEKSINCKLHAVDVYHDWIDACEAVNAAGKAAKTAAQDRNRDRARDRDDRDDDRPRRSKPYDRYDDDDD